MPTPYGMPFFVHACDVGARVGEKLECISGPDLSFSSLLVGTHAGGSTSSSRSVGARNSARDGLVGCWVCVAMSNLCRLIG